jgi:hypothetical protein
MSIGTSYSGCGAGLIAHCVGLRLVLAAVHSAFAVVQFTCTAFYMPLPCAHVGRDMSWSGLWRPLFNGLGLGPFIYRPPPPIPPSLPSLLPACVASLPQSPLTAARASCVLAPGRERLAVLDAPLCPSGLPSAVSRRQPQISLFYTITRGLAIFCSSSADTPPCST